MPSSKDMVRAALADAPEPFVVPFHSLWCELTQNEQVYSEAAIAHVVKWMRGEYEVTRVGRLSPSMLANVCHRQSLFTFAGVPKKEESPDSKDLMDVGSWDHLKWQAEGLTFPFDDPYMLEVEKFILDPAMRFGGRIDAILKDGSIFELKTAYFSVMNKVLESGAKFEHRKQLVGYWWLTGIPAASLVYYERGSGNYYEIREEDISTDHEAIEAAEEQLDALNAFVDNEALPDMLSDCRLKAGKIYKQCAFRQICPKLNSLTEAQATAPERSAA